MLQDWTTAFIDGNLCLPSQNLFIPTDFSIRDPAPKVITALPALFASLTIQGTYIWSFFIGSIVSKYLLYPMQEQASEVGLYEVCCFNLHRSNTHSYWGRLHSQDYGTSQTPSSTHPRLAFRSSSIVLSPTTPQKQLFSRAFSLGYLLTTWMNMVSSLSSFLVIIVDPSARDCTIVFNWNEDS